MKRTVGLCLALFFLVNVGTFASSETSNSTAFVPELLTTAYNESLKPVFTALSLDASTVAAIEAYAKVSFLTQEGAAVVYANEAQTIFFFFGATSRYSAADNVMFYTSLKDDNPLKNLPQNAFTYAVCTLDTTCDFVSFGSWANDATDGATYDALTFDAVYKLEDSDNASIILVK